MFVCSAFTCLLLTLALLLLHNYVDAVEAAGNAPAAAWAEATTPPAVPETTGRHETLALAAIVVSRHHCSAKQNR